MDAESGVARWLAFRRVGLGSVNFALLLKHFGSIDEAWDSPADELHRAGIESPYVRAIVRARTTLDEAEELSLMEKAGARAITWLDADYPPLLRDIPQSPPVLVIRGEGSASLELGVAVVGTRRITPYGRRVAEYFCEAFCRMNVAIVSGLARGVDAVAHRVAVESGAVTVGVLAGGLDEIYPKEHTSLAARIQERGCILSEYPIGVPARPDYFPRRNRILAGLSMATVVIEAGEGSGALHTANWAFEQGRDVYAVPGSVFARQSVACHKLVRDNVATLATDPEQILAALNVMTGGAQYALPVGASHSDALLIESLSPSERVAFKSIGASPQHVDKLARELGMPVGQLSALFTTLELRGAVKQVSPMTYVRAAPSRA